MKEAKDAYLLSQESKLTRVNMQLNLCPSKSTTTVLKEHSSTKLSHAQAQ